jgi:hypothetical protein
MRPAILEHRSSKHPADRRPQGLIGGSTKLHFATMHHVANKACPSFAGFVGRAFFFLGSFVRQAMLFAQPSSQIDQATTLRAERHCRVVRWINRSATDGARKRA